MFLDMIPMTVVDILMVGISTFQTSQFEQLLAPVLVVKKATPPETTIFSSQLVLQMLEASQEFL